MDTSLMVASEEGHSSALIVEKSVTKPPTVSNGDATKHDTIPNCSFASSAAKQVIHSIDVPHCYDNRSNPSQITNTVLSHDTSRLPSYLNLKSGILER